MVSILTIIFYYLGGNVNSNPNQNAELIITTEKAVDENLPLILTQEQAHHSLSDRYSLVKTADVIKVFQNAGFNWTLVSQEKCRGGYAGYGTHLVALEHPDIVFTDSTLDREIKPRLYLRNSYHGRSRLALDLGVFRAYCANGLFIGTMIQSFRTRHVGLDKKDLNQVVLDMKKAFGETVLPTIERLMQTQLSDEEQLQFAKMALAERMISNEGYIGGEHEKLLTVHRNEDKSNTAWSVLNRVQENLGLNFRPAPVDINYRILSKDKEGNTVTKERKMGKIGRLKEVTRMNQYLFDNIVNDTPTTESKLLIAA